MVQPEPSDTSDDVLKVPVEALVITAPEASKVVVPELTVKLPAFETVHPDEMWSLPPVVKLPVVVLFNEDPAAASVTSELAVIVPELLNEHPELIVKVVKTILLLAPMISEDPAALKVALPSTVKVWFVPAGIFKLKPLLIEKEPAIVRFADRVRTVEPLIVSDLQLAVTLTVGLFVVAGMVTSSEDVGTVPLDQLLPSPQKVPEAPAAPCHEIAAALAFVKPSARVNAAKQNNNCFFKTFTFKLVTEQAITMLITNSAFNNMQIISVNIINIAFFPLCYK